MADQGSGQQQQGNVEDASRSRTNEQAGTRGQETAAPSAANGPAPSGQRKITTADVALVQVLIERCLQLYMGQQEVQQALHQQAQIAPEFTQLVWSKLEQENATFFKAYYTRLKLKDQIILFNYLLDQQVTLMQQARHSSWPSPHGLAAPDGAGPAGMGGMGPPPPSNRILDMVTDRQLKGLLSPAINSMSPLIGPGTSPMLMSTMDPHMDGPNSAFKLFGMTDFGDQGGEHDVKLELSSLLSNDVLDEAIVGHLPRVLSLPEMDELA